MSRDNPSLVWHAVMDMGAIGWDNDCKQAKLSHKPGVAGLHKRNFYLQLYCKSCVNKCKKITLGYFDFTVKERNM